VGGVTGQVGGWEIPDVAVGSRYAVRPSRLAHPLHVMRVSGRLVPVTTWVHPDEFVGAAPYQPVGRYGHWTRSPSALGGLVVAVVVAATLVVCVVIALLALVAWVTAHALAVGAALAVVVVTALAFLRSLSGARNAGPPPHGGCCR
jgi:hypothetical protein